MPKETMWNTDLLETRGNDANVMRSCIIIQDEICFMIAPVNDDIYKHQHSITNGRIGFLEIYPSSPLLRFQTLRTTP